jgi:hypothetical protein
MRHHHPFILLFILSGLFLNNCTREKIEQANPICFETEVLPIFQSNCTQSGCHNAQDREQGYDLSNYDGIVRKGIRPGDFKNSELYQVLIQPLGQMPPNPYNRLTVDQITTIALWIDEGAENNICASTPCDTTTVTYSATIQPILADYCLGCHSGGSPSGNISYETHAGVKQTAIDGTLSGSIKHLSGFSPMPQNANQLTACQISKIESWISRGALDN